MCRWTQAMPLTPDTLAPGLSLASSAEASSPRDPVSGGGRPDAEALTPRRGPPRPRFRGAADSSANLCDSSIPPRRRGRGETMPPFIQPVSHSSRLALGRCKKGKRELPLTRVQMSPLRPRGPERPVPPGLARLGAFHITPAHATRAPGTRDPISVGSRPTPPAGPNLAPFTEPLHGLQRTGTRDRAGLGLLIVNAVIRPPQRQPQTHEPSRADRRHPAPDEHDGAGGTHSGTRLLDAPPSLLRQPGSAPSAWRSGVY